MSVSVIIMTLNAGRYLHRQLEAIKKQSVTPDEILVVDSQSEDDTREIAAHAGVRVIPVLRSEFDHGKTRDMALRAARGEYIVFMTQDALPADERFLEKLLEPLKDGQVAAVGGRQIAWPDARAYEKLVRKHNYPDVSRVWSAGDIAQLGVRAFLISDVSAAYRREAYLAVGGFDYPILTNEDMLMAERLLHAGYKLAYSGEAAVYHSHNLTMTQEYRRNYIVGRTMKRYEQRFEHVGEMGTGIRLVKDVMLELARGGQAASCIGFAANCAARLLGNRLGRMKETREIARAEKRK